MKSVLGLTITAIGLLAGNPVMAEQPSQCAPHLQFIAPKLHVQGDVDFCSEFKGQVVLAVNTASHCGFTPQFDGLEKLHQKYKDKGLSIVGFPSDDFRQESSDEKDIAEVCYVNYGVTFPMVSASSVKGDKANDFFQWLIAESGKQPQWNFNKYLIAEDGTSVTHFSSSAAPEGGELEAAVQAALKDAGLL